MEKMAHDEKTLKSQILYLMQGEKEAVSFGTLLSLLDMSELERAWLHILLLDLCRDGYLKLPEGPCSSLDDVMFLPGERKITGDVFETVSGAAENESAAVQSDSGTSEEDAGKTEHDHACGDVLPPADSGTDIPAESEDTVPKAGEYALSLYRKLVTSLKEKPEWKTVRDLLAKGAWPAKQEICELLPELLVRMAAAGTVEIRTERDSIRGVKPVIRLAAEGEEKVPAESVLEILAAVPGEPAESVLEETSSDMQNGVPAEKPETPSPETGKRAPESEKEAKTDDLKAVTESAPSADSPASAKNKLPVASVVKPAPRYGIFDSWEVLDENTAVKHCDKSFFAYHGSGVPKGILWFFNAEKLGSCQGTGLKLIYQGREFQGMVKRDLLGSGRTRIFWNSMLGEILQDFSDDDDAEAIFRRAGENTYEITIKCSKDSQDNSDQQTLPPEILLTAAPAGNTSPEKQAQGSQRTISGMTQLSENKAEEAPPAAVAEKAADAAVTEAAPAGHDGSVDSDSKLNNDRKDRLIPYGYERKYFDIKVNESEAVVVHAIFKMQESGMQPDEIAAGLSSQGIRTRLGSAFTEAEITEILNKRYLYEGRRSAYPRILLLNWKSMFNRISDRKGACSVRRTPENNRESAVSRIGRAKNLTADLLDSLVSDRNAEVQPGMKVPGIKQKETVLPAHAPEKMQEVMNTPLISRDQSDQRPDESVRTPATPEEVQEEIYRVLYENPGYHSVESLKILSTGLNQVPEYKIIFNANTLKTRGLIDEIITSPPDPVMYLYSAKIRASAGPDQDV